VNEVPSPEDRNPFPAISHKGKKALLCEGVLGRANLTNIRQLQMLCSVVRDEKFYFEGGVRGYYGFVVVSYVG
jgi:hypothetical protein